MPEAGIREILVIAVSRIGDTLLATPAIRALARAYPEARITCLAHPKRMEVLYHLPFVHRVAGITKHRARLMGRFAGSRYDLAFVYGFDRPLVAYALRVARRVVAFRQADRGLDERLYLAVPPPGFQSMHSVHLNLALVQAAGVPPAGYALSYRVTPQEVEWARERIARVAPPEAAPRIGLQIASFPTKGYRDWPVEHFATLCERIGARRGRAHFFILGGHDERARAASLAGRFPDRSTLLAGRLTLRQTAAVMSQLDLYIGVDTGPTHIMGTMNIPMVVLYHCYSPSWLLAPLEHPCLYAVDHPRRREDCSPETAMAELDVDSVWRRVEEALGAPLRARAAPGR